MYLVVIAWVYVAMMMAVAEASSSQGSLLGGMVTFVLYGMVPVALVVYLMRAPARRKAIRAQAVAERAAAAGEDPAHATQPSPATGASVLPDAGSEAPADTVAPVRKET